MEFGDGAVLEPTLTKEIDAYGPGVSWSPDGGRIGMECEGGLAVVDPDTLDVLHTVQFEEESAGAVFHPNGLHVLVLFDGPLRAFHLPPALTGGRTAVCGPLRGYNALPVRVGPVLNNLAISPDGKVLAMAAGVSRLYGLPQFLATVALAVAPVPLGFFLFM